MTVALRSYHDGMSRADPSPDVPPGLWSARDVAEQLGLGSATAARVWIARNRVPWRQLGGRNQSTRLYDPGDVQVVRAVLKARTALTPGQFNTLAERLDARLHKGTPLSAEDVAGFVRQCKGAP